MAGNDVFPLFHRSAVISSAVSRIRLRFFPDHYGQELIRLVRIGEMLDVRRHIFAPEPNWLLQFRAGPSAQVKELFTSTYLHIIKHSKDGLLVKFHSETGRIVDELSTLARQMGCDKKLIASFLTRYREYMTGDRKTFPRLPKGSSDQILLLSTCDYGMKLMRGNWEGKPLPTQDYAAIYRVPLDSMVEALGSASLPLIIDLVNRYRG